METAGSQADHQTAPKFTCSICSKNFDSNKSHIRHTSYCRKKARNPLKPRKRSCLSCTKAKTHCDAEFPSCLRCLKKDVTCQYQNIPQHVKPPEGPSQQEHVPDTVHSSEISTSLDTFANSFLLQHYGNSASDDHDNASALEVAGFLSPKFLDPFSWSSTLSDGVDSSYATLSTFPEDFNRNVVRSPDKFGDMSFLGLSPQQSPEKGLISYAPMTISKVPAEGNLFPGHRYSADFSNLQALSPLGIQPAFRAPRVFWPRKVRYRQLSLNQKYAICTLRSYPHYLLPGKGMPPFIHPQCQIQKVSQDGRVAQTSIPEALAKCAGIIAMWSVKDKNNSVFIWRAIRSEQERLSKECWKMNDQNAVAALQAISIYFILRINEKDEEATDFDIPLILTMMRLALKVKGVTAKYSSNEVGQLPTWETWILAESLRRTIFVLFIVDFVFDFASGVGHDCAVNSELGYMRLPCTKSLWSAQNKSDWEREYVASGQNHNNYRHPAFGDLLSHDAENNPFGNALDHWLAEMDEFGTLLVAAASLAERDEHIAS